VGGRHRQVEITGFTDRFSAIKGFGDCKLARTVLKEARDAKGLFPAFRSG